MKIAPLLSVLLLGSLSLHLQAQSCCDKLRQQGIEAYTKGEYNTAIIKWEAAKGCASKCSTDDLDVKIKDAKVKLNPPKKQEIKPKPPKTEPKKVIQQPPTIDRARIKRLLQDAKISLQADDVEGAKKFLKDAQKLDKDNSIIKDALHLIDLEDVEGAILVLKKAQ